MDVAGKARFRGRHRRECWAAATRPWGRDDTRPHGGSPSAPVTTSLPAAWPASITRCASAISSNANTRDGLRPVDAGLTLVDDLLERDRRDRDTRSLPTSKLPKKLNCTPLGRSKAGRKSVDRAEAAQEPGLAHAAPGPDRSQRVAQDAVPDQVEHPVGAARHQAADLAGDRRRSRSRRPRRPVSAAARRGPRAGWSRSPGRRDRWRCSPPPGRARRSRPGRAATARPPARGCRRSASQAVA